MKAEKPQKRILEQVSVYRQYDKGYNHAHGEWERYLASLKTLVLKGLPEGKYKFKDPRSKGYDVDFNEGFNSALKQCREKIREIFE